MSAAPLPVPVPLITLLRQISSDKKTGAAVTTSSAASTLSTDTKQAITISADARRVVNTRLGWLKHQPLASNAAARHPADDDVLHRSASVAIHISALIRQLSAEAKAAAAAAAVSDDDTGPDTGAAAPPVSVSFTCEDDPYSIRKRSSNYADQKRRTERLASDYRLRRKPRDSMMAVAPSSLPRKVFGGPYQFDTGGREVPAPPHPTRGVRPLTESLAPPDPSRYESRPQENERNKLEADAIAAARAAAESKLAAAEIEIEQMRKERAIAIAASRDQSGKHKKNVSASAVTASNEHDYRTPVPPVAPAVVEPIPPAVAAAAVPPAVRLARMTASRLSHTRDQKRGGQRVAQRSQTSGGHVFDPSDLPTRKSAAATAARKWDTHSRDSVDDITRRHRISDERERFVNAALSRSKPGRRDWKEIIRGLSQGWLWY